MVLRIAFAVALIVVLASAGAAQKPVRQPDAQTQPGLAPQAECPQAGAMRFTSPWRVAARRDRHTHIYFRDLRCADGRMAQLRRDVRESAGPVEEQFQLVPRDWIPQDRIARLIDHPTACSAVVAYCVDWGAPGSDADFPVDTRSLEPTPITVTGETWREYSVLFQEGAVAGAQALNAHFERRQREILPYGWRPQDTRFDRNFMSHPGMFEAMYGFPLTPQRPLPGGLIRGGPTPGGGIAN